MKLAIIGGRSFNNYDLLDKTIAKYFCSFAGCDVLFPEFNELVSGGAFGADKMGEIWVDKYNQISPNKIKKTIFLPNWNLYGKRAGFIRNEDIIKNSDMVLAFWDGESKGTANSLSIAKRLKKNTLIIYY